MTPVHSTLTPRETQVLQRLVEGSTTREIAERYGIAHQTVKNYVTVIYEKLGARNRSQVLRLWQSGEAVAGRIDVDRHPR